MGAVLIHHHHHAQGHAPGVFPHFEQACTRNDVNAFEQEVDAFPSSPFNGGRDARFNSEAGFVPIQYGLATASSREGRAVQRFSLLIPICRPHDFTNGVGRHDPGESGSVGDADGCRRFPNPGGPGDDEQPRRSRGEGLRCLLRHPYPLGHADEVQGRAHEGSAQGCVPFHHLVPEKTHRWPFESGGLGRFMADEQMWIAGAWCDAEKNETSDVINPATGEIMATVPKATVGDVDRCVAASRDALNNADWKAMDPAQRGRILNKMAAVTYGKAKELAVIESSNNGKTFREALSEIRYGAWTLEYFAGLADKIEGTTIPVPGPRLNYTLRQPLGVTAHIVPWNFPLQLALRSIAPALAAGCTVIAKPASWTPLSLLAWAKAVDEADTGLPSGVLQVLTGSGALAGDALAGHAGVDGVVLTGGVPTGQAVMAKASEQLTPVTLELGGKGANIVFPDANLRYAAKAICFGIFMNAGQMCWAGSRLLVHEDVHDDLVEAVCAEVAKWPVGPGMEEGVRMGSLVHERHRIEVLEKLEAGLKEGGELVLGGKPLDRDGAFMEATVVTGVDRSHLLFQDELFGPVLAVTSFSTDEEALELANDTPFGLLNGVWTNNLSRAHSFARDLECGMVSINEYPITFPQTAFTGWKHSGIGVEQSQDALRFYTKVKNVNVKL